MRVQQKKRENHGESAPGLWTAEYRAWVNMINRCRRTDRRRRRWYFDKGIRVCARWRRSYLAFLADVGRRPTSGHTLDRIKGNLGYKPGNVRWATWIEQARNRGGMFA